jgi:hypothetical protein
MATVPVATVGGGQSAVMGNELVQRGDGIG